MTGISIIIAANNESDYIIGCLKALLAQDYQGPAQVIVSANGCTDDTVARAATLTESFAARGWALDIVDWPEGGKAAAINRADDAAVYPTRMYMDADIIVDANMIGALVAALAVDMPRLAGGKLIVAPASSWISRAYGRFWSRLPFMTNNVTAAGLLAVNAAGRARWGRFPQIIADDSYARLQFHEDERLRVASSYLWPLTEGFSRLVRVRRRQDRGGQQIAELYPELLERQGHVRPSVREVVGLAFRDPLGFAVYATVSLAVRTKRGGTEWSRGR